jgi:hypothetical protein
MSLANSCFHELELHFPAPVKCFTILEPFSFNIRIGPTLEGGIPFSTCRRTEWLDHPICLKSDTELVLFDLGVLNRCVNESAHLMAREASPTAQEMRDFLAFFWPQIHVAHGYDELYLLVTNKFLAGICVSCVNEFFANP